jgi:hypothetical protein
MNVEIGAEAAQFPEKEYICGIAVAVQKENKIFYSIRRCEEEEKRGETPPSLLFKKTK